jgi:LacI family transcriptional regulator
MNAPMNLKRLAAELGLSQTTVSRAINGFPEVSEKTRHRVQAAAQSLGYRPSPAARRLATGVSGTLGLIFPAQRNMLIDLIFTEFLSGTLERAAELGFDISLALVRAGMTEEEAYRQAVRNARVDGIILSSPLLEDPRPALLSDLGMPFILHGRSRIDVPHVYLDIDNRGAFHDATRLLIDHGHRRIALLNDDLRYNFAMDRQDGFCAALKEAGRVRDRGLMANGPMVEEHGLTAARTMLARADAPTAFLCSSIFQATGVYRACREAGLRIGTDVAVIAHDDCLSAASPDRMEPPLTTTQSSISDAGRVITERLVGLAHNSTEPMASEIWPVTLIIRESTPPRRPAKRHASGRS